jgi:hypothetical protein
MRKIYLSLIQDPEIPGEEINYPHFHQVNNVSPF